MKIIFETERLLFREFTEDDAQLLFDLNKDEAIRKYVHEPAPTLASAQSALKEIILPQYYLYNYGRWALHLKTTNGFIGWCGLKYMKESEEVDLGYRLMKKYWNKGYATEAAKATIKYGFENFQVERIIARAHKENIASIKVIEKCGIKFLCDEIYKNDPVKTFALTKVEYFAK